MLHRAATNAHSWWWASHIRTKQSKWLEQNLVDMEEMVQSMLKIIEQEGDSFVKRVEMYYKKRPELIHFVEEAYRAYRALAERYEHLSKDLQNANRTIATVFPDQMQLSMESNDVTSSHGSIPPSPDHSEKSFKRIPSPKSFPRQPPQFPTGDSVIATKKEQLRRAATSLTNSSGLTKEEAAKEIDTLQKDVLALQTEKEYLKSSYEAAMGKYWETEGKISDLYSRVYNLQDEFGIGTLIGDQEARTLMATTALTSCSEALNKVQAEQERSTEEVKGQYARIKEVHERLQTLKQQINQKQEALTPKSFELESTDSLRKKIKEKLSAECNVALTEPELADRIDELVQKIVILETTIFSQNGQLKILKQYIDELVENISNLEGSKESLVQNEENTRRIVELEEELSKVKSLNQDLMERKNEINAELTETNCNLDHLMEKLENVKPTEEAEDEPEIEAEAESEKEESAIRDSEVRDLRLEEKDGMNWRTMYTTNIEEREGILLSEYTVILRDYKDNKIKLSEAEKKNREYFVDLTTLARELRNTIVSKDEEIKHLLRKLNDVENAELEKTETFKTPKERDPDLQQQQQHHHERSISAGEPGRRWGYSFEPDRQPLFHHLYDPKKSGIMARNTSLAENSSRKRDVPLAEPPAGTVSRVQARLRNELNNVLEGNLGFWMRFSTSLQQIQKFQATIKDLQADLSKLRNTKEGSDNEHSLMALQSDAKPLYKHLREIQTEMALWHEHSTVFHDELRSRFASLNNIQGEIVKVLSAGKKSGYPEIHEFQAAQFQGEIINMNQENKKVEEELQLGIHKVKELRKETEKALLKMEKEFKLTEYKRGYSGIIKTPSSKSKIPLHAFLFGMRLKKNKQKNLTISG